MGEWLKISLGQNLAEQALKNLSKENVSKTTSFKSLSSWIKSGDKKLKARIDKGNVSSSEFLKILANEFSKKDVYSTNSLLTKVNTMVNSNIKPEDKHYKEYRSILDVLEAELKKRIKND